MSSGLNDRILDLGSGNPDNAPTSPADNEEPLIQRCVIIQRDVKGYGLTVSGDNPVFIQSVKEDGPADKAGVRDGDQIIKVNGTLVTSSNHEKVVEMIKSGTYVALTLLGRPPEVNNKTASSSSTLQPLNHTPSPAWERITGPQPVDSEKQHQLNNSRILTIKKMLGREMLYMKTLESQCHKTPPTEKIRLELAGARKRIQTLEDQLFNLTGVRHDLHNSLPTSPPPCLSEKENIRASTGGALSYIKSFTHQSSAPCLPRPPPHQSFCGVADLPRPLLQHKMTLSTSLENLAKHFSPRTHTWPHGVATQASHSRQSSTPVEGSAPPPPLQTQTSLPKDNSVFKLAFSSNDSARHSRKNPSSSDPEIKKSKRKKKHPSFTTSISTDALARLDQSPEGMMPEDTQSPAPLSPEPQDVREMCDEPSSEVGDHPKPDDSPAGKATSPTQPGNCTTTDGRVSPLPPQNLNILCMEEDDFSDSELGALDHHGPFNGIWKLVRHPAHLAVFIHYLNLNGDPSTLFFYLIAEMYEQGTLKEMKKWAYEIHSSFLVPGAPLQVKNIDEAILNEIDDVLQHSLDKEEVARSVFKKAVGKAKEELGDQLAEFRNKRTMGLGNFFGPADSQLEEAIHDRAAELRIIESLLQPTLESLMGEDIESGSADRNVAKAYALATIMKQMGAAKSQACLNLIDRCPSYVAKEKTLLRILKTRKMSQQQVGVKGHLFHPQHYQSTTYCSHCQLLIWGIGNQGYHCHHCELNIHKQCLKVMDENCFGSLRNSTKKDKKLMDKNWFGKNRKISQTVLPSAIEHAKRLMMEDSQDSSGPEMSSEPSGTGNKSLSSSTDPAAESVSPPVSGPADAKSIGRSESFRQRRESRPSFRKRSDPNIPRSKSDVEDGKTNLDESGSSSNSSLSASRSLDSPSVEATTTPRDYEDSDLEAEVDPPDWQKLLDWEVLRLLKPKEKKRQDVINELFHTERTHVKNLKVLDKLFYRPLLLAPDLLPPEHLHLLFPNLEQMISIHSAFNSAMKARRKQEALIGNVGPMMLQMLDGTSGEDLKEAAAVFCSNQSIALEMLKQRQKKDQKVGQFLSDAEAHPLCRRLQLKDIIATGFQRLSKYPLLLENIAKYTTPNTEEHRQILQSLESSRNILAHVNQAVKETDNQHRLAELQRKVDKSSLDKQYKTLDLTKHRMLYEGGLSWRLNKQKSLEVHVVLLEEILLLFQRQDDKLVLRNHNCSITADTKVAYHPVLQVQNIFTRNVAVDKRGFFLVSTSEPHGAMYEFVASSAAERKNWLRQITEAIEACKHKNHSTTENQQQQQQPIESTPEDMEAKSRTISAATSSEDSQESLLPPGEEPPAVATQPPSEEPAVDSQPAEEKPPDPPPAEEEKPPRRLQRVEILQIADGPKLIEPSEVVVRPEATLQTAEPVLTPLERLRRKDTQIAEALAEKEKLIALYLQIPPENLPALKEQNDVDSQMDVRELVFSAIGQVNQLTSLLNDSLTVTEEDAIAASSGSAASMSADGTATSPPLGRRVLRLPDRLRSIAAVLSQQLTHIMALVKEGEEERLQLRQELQRSREQVHHFYESHRDCPILAPSPPLQNGGDSCGAPPPPPQVIAEDLPAEDCPSAMVESTASAEVFVDAPSSPAKESSTTTNVPPPSSYHQEPIYF